PTVERPGRPADHPRPSSRPTRNPFSPHRSKRFRKRPGASRLSYRLAAAYNEVPALLALVLVALTLPGLLDPAVEPAGRAAALVLALLVLAGFVAIAWRGARARPVVARALDDGLGAGWDAQLDPRLGLGRRLPVGRQVVPFVF